MKYDFERMLRLEGKQPTAREKWNAFYRAWRASVGKNAASNVIDAWWVLGIDPTWIRLMNSTGDLYDLLRFMPKSVRRDRVERARRERRQYEQRMALARAWASLRNARWLNYGGF